MANVCRDLQFQEFELIDWMLRNGCIDAGQHLEQLRGARVCGQCRCGCASINLKVYDHEPDWSCGMRALADYRWRDASGRLMGALLYAHHHQLAGLEVWSIDGTALPRELPRPDDLRSNT